MVQPLFLEPAAYTEKIAVEMRLPPDPNKWPMEIVQELYKQVPYIADFEPHVEMDRADGEKGYGFGHVAISNQTEAPGGSSPEQLHAAGIRTVRVPVVIREGMLQPLDLLVTDDSKIIPLTEPRLRQSIFRPQAFDVTARTPGDQSMIGQLYPPYRQNYGMGGGGMAMSTGIGKQSSVEKTAAKPADVAKAVERAAVGASPERLKHFAWKMGRGSLRQAMPRGKTLLKHNVPEMHEKYRAARDAALGMLQKQSEARSDLERYLETEALTEKNAAMIDDYLAGDRQHARPGKHSVTVDFRPGNLGEFINKHASAGVAAPYQRPSSKKTASVLEAILPTIGVQDYLGFTDALQEPGMSAAFAKNAAATYPSIKLLLEHDPSAKSTTKIAGVLDGLLSPSVVQIRRLGDGQYGVKTASHLYWKPSNKIANRADIVGMFGEKVALAADTDGSVTMGAGAETVTPEAEEGPKAGPITHAGLYKVQDNQGKEHLGAVIPNLIDVDGKELPISLFTNGTVSAVQTDIVGVPAGKAMNLPTGTPKGHGFFFKAEGDRMRATIPFQFQATTAMPGQPTDMVGETFDGRPVQVSQQPGIQAVMTTPDGKLLIPQDWRWSPLDRTEEVDLAGGEDDLGKEAQVQRYLESVAVRGSTGGIFTIDGLAIDKVASADKHGLDVDGAMFLLTALGVEPGCAIQKLGQSMVGDGLVLVKVGRSIRDAGDELAEARVKAAARQLPDLRQSLVKEAAFITDPTAVDTVLSLGFINPENMNTFVAYLPEIDEAQGHMCELLLAARLGMTSTPVGALEKAVKATEQVIEGLKVLAFTS